jgi:undecaprenyl-diphosphatase
LDNQTTTDIGAHAGVNILEAVVLGAVEGLTEFLPVSSTGHLTIVEKLFHENIDDPDITAFTAIIQVGAEIALIVYLRKDIWRIITGFLAGLFRRRPSSDPDYRFGWAVILGSIPIAIIGLLFKDQIETTLRSLWFVGAALIIWSGAMWFADRAATQTRHEPDVTWKDTLIIGVAQCLALIPGISRSGATMSAGLLRDFDRVTVTRLSFFLSIPALLAAAVLQTVSEFGNISDGVGWPATILATLVSGIVGYLAVNWLLKFIAGHTYTLFIVYRVILGTVVLLLVATGTVAST